MYAFLGLCASSLLNFIIIFLIIEIKAISLTTKICTGLFESVVVVAF